MKAKGFYFLTAVLLIVGVVVFYSCKKDNTTDNSTVAATTVNEAQQSESQDAIADKVDQDMDNNLDKLESNGYSTSTAKVALDDCVGVSIDSTTLAGGWPRTVTLTYDCQDTINKEVISQLGTIKVIVNRGSHTAGGYLYTRSITFDNYKVTIDSISLFNPASSPSITINGTRTLTRTKISGSKISDKLINVDVTDSITPGISGMNFTINYGDTTITFTREVSRKRVAELYMRRLTLLSRWYSSISDDTITYTGMVNGINARKWNYTREITTPIVCTFCSSWPHNIVISSGEIDFSNSSGKVGNITYSADGCKTIVTLTNSKGKTKVIERKFGRKFHRWW